MTELADNTFDYIVQKLYWDGVGQTIEDREAFEAGVFTFLNENDTCRAFNQKDKFMPKVSDFLPGTRFFGQYSRAFQVVTSLRAR